MGDGGTGEGGGFHSCGVSCVSQVTNDQRMHSLHRVHVCVDRVCVCLFVCHAVCDTSQHTSFTVYTALFVSSDWCCVVWYCGDAAMLTAAAHVMAKVVGGRVCSSGNHPSELFCV
jgi:hypothetical protein